MDVLYVDDDNDDRQIFAELLKEMYPGIHLILARDGEEAIDILTRRSSAPNVIFLDVNMPVMDGFQTLAAIRKIGNLMDTKIVMYSTNIDRHLEERLEDSNTLFAKKCNTVEEIRETLLSILVGEAKPPDC